MQVLLHSDANTDGSRLMASHLEVVVTKALGRFAERITRVEAHLSDVNGHARPGTDDIHCTLEAKLAGLEAVIARDHAGNAHQAIEGAVHKLERAVGERFARHDPHHHHGKYESPADAATQDPPD